jgi:hypothetical protein
MRLAACGLILALVESTSIAAANMRSLVLAYLDDPIEHLPTPARALSRTSADDIKGAVHYRRALK